MTSIGQGGKCLNHCFPDSRCYLVFKTCGGLIDAVGVS